MNEPTETNSYCFSRKEEPRTVEFRSDVMEPFRELQREMNRKSEEECSPQSEVERSRSLLSASERLHACLVDIKREFVDADAADPEMTMPGFRDEVLRLLVGMHLRLLLLTNEVLVENGTLKGEIARTQGFVRNSASLLNSISMDQIPYRNGSRGM